MGSVREENLFSRLIRFDIFTDRNPAGSIVQNNLFIGCRITDYVRLGLSWGVYLNIFAQNHATNPRPSKSNRRWEVHAEIKPDDPVFVDDLIGKIRGDLWIDDIVESLTVRSR